MTMIALLVSVWMGVQAFPPPQVPAPSQPKPAGKESGAVSIKELDGEWTLVSLDGRKALPAGVEVTLTVRGREVSGSGGCNRFTGTLAPGADPSAVTFGPLAATMMACDGPAMDVETAFFEAMDAVSAFTFVSGRLALTYRHASGPRALTFKRR